MVITTFIESIAIALYGLKRASRGCRSKVAIAVVRGVVTILGIAVTLLPTIRSAMTASIFNSTTSISRSKKRQNRIAVTFVRGAGGV